MTFEFHKLSELIHKYGDSQSINRMVNREHPLLQPDQEGIFQYCLAEGPDKALKNMAGAIHRLEDICEELDIVVEQDKLNDEEFLRSQILQHLSEVPDFRELEINAFSVINQRIKILESPYEEKGLFSETLELVVNFEFLVRQSFDLITDDEILEDFDPKFRNRVKKANLSKPFGPVVRCMRELQNLTNKDENNDQSSSIDSFEIKNKRKFYHQIFSNNSPFQDIDFDDFDRLLNLRGSKLAHKSEYRSLSTIRKGKIIEEIINILDKLSVQFQKITPPIIVQVQRLTDQYGRDRIYYLEEKDFNEYGRLNTNGRQRMNIDGTWRQNCNFYCLIPHSNDSVKMFVPAYCRFESNKPIIQPRLIFTTDTITLDKESVKESIEEGITDGEF